MTIKKTDQEPYEYQGRYYQIYEKLTREEWPCLDCKVTLGEDLADMPDLWLERESPFTEINGSLYCPNCATIHDVSVGVRNEDGEIKKH